MAHGVDITELVMVLELMVLHQTLIYTIIIYTIMLAMAYTTMLVSPSLQKRTGGAQQTDLVE